MVRAAEVVDDAGNVARFTGAPREVVLEQEGIDDLAKYRIALHLIEHPGLVADAETIATTLGFHSIGRTVALLEEMVGDGLLSKIVPPGGLSRYGLVADSTLRARLGESFAVDGTYRYQLLLRHLAQRSAARVKRETKRNRAG